jgi:hypothetical protein
MNHDPYKNKQPRLLDQVGNVIRVKHYTLIERKLRVPQIRGIKGDAVVVYCEPLITKKMGCHRLSQRVNKMGFF